MVQDTNGNNDNGNNDATDGKTRFDHIYDMPDPREYFRALGRLDYDIPQRARPIFSRILENCRSQDAERGGVLDVCCSYGVNAALLRSDLSLADLYQHYSDPSISYLSPTELITADRAYFADHSGEKAPHMAGLDAARNAVSYACQVGLLDSGLAEDLERNDPSPQLIEALGHVGLITTTGGVGYITERTFDRLLQATPSGRSPWVAAFVLRMYSYDEIAETLGRHGLVTEELSEVSFHQRQFASAQEQESTVRAVRARGLDTTGLEDDGSFYATFFLSRPSEDAASEPLGELLSGLTEDQK